MAGPILMDFSRTYPVSVEHAFDTVLRLPPEQIFARWYGPIPALRRTEGPAEPWGEVGQERVLRLADGGSAREELTRVERPVAFGYTLTEVRGPFKLFASHVDGVWTFAPAGTGTRITWEWTFQPASGAAGVLLPAFRRLWTGYARRSFERLEQLLLPS